MTDVLTLTPNPALDVATTTPRVEPLAKLRCAPPSMDAGGGGINVARVVTRLGGDAVAGFLVGGATGERLRALVEAEGIATRPVPLAGETRQSLNITDAGSGEQYRFVLPGPEIVPQEEEALLAQIAEVRPAWVVLSGSLPPGLSEGFPAAVARAADDAGARLVVDGPTVLMARCRAAFVVKPNLKALEGIAGRPLPTRADQIGHARRMIAGGVTRNVLLSLGEDGALLVSQDEATAFRTPVVPPASAVGAGDSMVGAMVHALSRGGSLVEAVGDGVAAGAAALLTAGTGLCHPEDVRRLRPEVGVEPVADDRPAA